MDSISLIGPAVIAAVVTGIVATIGIMINRSTSLRTHREKLKTDLDLAERKAKFDEALAEKKLRLDQQLADWKRRTELAEQVLADFYKARDIFSDARRPFAIAGEGASRPNRAVGETEGETGHRDAIYAPYERLLKERDFLSEMHSRRFRFMALFGDEAATPFLTVVRAFNEVGSAVGILISHGHIMEDKQRNRYEAVMGWGLTDKDELKDRLNEAVAKIEALCTPVLREAPQ